MTLLLFAHPCEACATIEMFKATLVNKKTTSSSFYNPKLYTFEGGFICITGVGVHAAAAAVASFSSQDQLVINLGFAGALDSSLSYGAIYPISSCRKLYPMMPQPLSAMAQSSLPTLLCSKKGLQLISSDVPIHQAAMKQTLFEQGAQLVDMEGYGIAHMCQATGRSFKLWKIVSDFSEEGGSALIQKHQAELSQLLASFAYKLLNASTDTDPYCETLHNDALKA